MFVCFLFWLCAFVAVFVWFVCLAFVLACCGEIGVIFENNKNINKR